METFVFKDVNFCYPGREKKALDKMSFSIGESQFVLICGKSGCGKSTLLRHMKKSLIPYGEGEGEIYYCGQDFMHLDDRRDAEEIGFVGQDPENQIVTDKVWHEMAFGLENLGLSTNSIRRRVSEMACYFGIQSWFRKNTSELSGGQKQLLNLASVMAMYPKVIVLDEPTAQLDPIAALEFLETLRKINRDLGITIVISEHRLEEVFPMADKVMVMEEGRLCFWGTPRETGAYLSGGKCRHEMFLGLPAPMKIYADVDGGGDYPLTIREGRLWLSKVFPKIMLKSLPESEEEPGEDREKAVTIKNAWFRYERNSEDVVRDLSLSIETGEFFCLLGGNGAGKSTTLGIVSGVNKPWRGAIRILGKPLEKYKGNELFTNCLGVLPQNPASVFTEITAEEELYEALYYDPVPKEEKLLRIQQMMQKMQLGGMEQAHPYDLSGGEKQRLALGKILLREPKILLLDEPTKGLDPFFKTILADILRELKNQGVTIFMVTHDIEFCGEYADRCAMFFDGGISAIDTPHEFFGGNNFYTTAANRMSRHLFERAITYREVVELCGRNIQKNNS
ncbi:ATP-binding cassette domain-containing protein [Lacrimispora sp. NSJ-141]|uniref:ATP-binding cassette domain-containing protein n=1 Tax=Lientehia hominis TaxID=2897778 RepID=A0AAP2RFP1_9FIRM|nr:ATP-binding cassette domain-containing protein [Lientehia hominis]MCD2491137.1 ATP-binding cassette domain-containing protein [Lientehia hominis]